MLGWEFPPFITGGLGTACYGLTKALSRRGVDVLFVLPRAVDLNYASHVRVLGPENGNGAALSAKSPSAMTLASSARQRLTTAAEPMPPEAATRAERHAFPELSKSQTYQMEGFEHVTFRTVPSAITNPYHLRHQPRTLAELLAQQRLMGGRGAGTPPGADDIGANQPTGAGARDGGPDYEGDIVTQSQRYAELCAVLTRGEEFDVIHAHDWMTFPAGLKIAAATGKPLVVHVHSTEYDRAGEHGSRAIYDIERRGMHGAMKVVCVSYLTRNLCIRRYGVPAEKVQVCYNGIENNGSVLRREPIRKGDKIVLFLGRVTMQKGPEYFIAAARKVIEKVQNVKFVVAGSGDMIERINRMAKEYGIAHKVVFTGFLRGSDVERVFRMADVYVMPSVSEPFGIAPLEAIRHDVPVIISRNSGVAEVVKHALKVDFWDTDDIANKIIAVLRHPPLSQTLREQADIEVRTLTWDGAANRCVKVYQEAAEAMAEPALRN